MDTIVLNGFSCGIVRSEEIPLESVEKTRKEWSQSGMICWTTSVKSSRSQESLRGGYNKKNPNQQA
jgi:hypothetical protein